MAIVSVNIAGGLGNQLFELATAVAYALDNHYVLRIKREDITDRHAASPRPTYWANALRSMGSYLVDQLPPLTVWNEPCYHYRLIPPGLARHLLCGNFQSRKHFEHRLPEVHAALGLVSQIPPPINAIGVHFRIGDFAHQQHNHPVLTPDYYSNALAHIAQRDPATLRVIVLCEEPDRATVAKVLFRLRCEQPLMAFEYISDELGVTKDWEQMLTFAACKHHIVANSTFSWWGAFLARPNCGIVCRPTRWTGPAIPLNTADVWPEEWIAFDD